jgi:hypothetical protein
VKNGFSRSIASLQSFFAEPGPGVTEVSQLPVSVCTEQQCSKMLATTSSFGEAAHDEFLLRSWLNLQSIGWAFSRSINAGFSLCDYSFETFCFRETEEISSMILDVTADQDTGDWSDYHFQSLASLLDSLGGEITPVTPD